MATTPTPVLLQTPKHYQLRVSTGTSTVATTLATGGSNGTKITSIIGSMSDGVATNIQVGITNTSIFYPLGTVQMPANAGTSTSNLAVNLLDPTVIKGLPVDNDGQSYIFLTSTLDTLQVQALTTGTTGTFIYYNAFGADF